MNRHLTVLMATLVALACGIGGLIGMMLPADRVLENQRIDPPDGWEQSSWPFLKDQFPAGLSFECRVGPCADGTRVTVRTKIGFCNCVTGVSDDEELERVGDRDLLGGDLMPVASGKEIEITGLHGRIRSFRSDVSRTSILSIAYNNHCDVVVATASGLTGELEHQVSILLSSPKIRQWVDGQLRR